MLQAQKKCDDTLYYSTLVWQVLACAPCLWYSAVVKMPDT